MNRSSKTTSSLPDWLWELLEEEPGEGSHGKRRKPRQYAGGLAWATRVGEPNGKPIAVRLYNVGPTGLCFTSRVEFARGTRVNLLPDGDPDIVAPKPAVKLSVVHCTGTVQGFKVGCELITEE
jgi:hypothetical protein